jgi:hypothetical protein
MVSDEYAQHMHQFLTRKQPSVPYPHAEGIQNEHLKNKKTDAHADGSGLGAHQFLTNMLSLRIKVGASAYKEFKYLKQQKVQTIAIVTNIWSQKLKEKIVWPKLN